MHERVFFVPICLLNYDSVFSHTHLQSITKLFSSLVGRHVPVQLALTHVFVGRPKPPTLQVPVGDGVGDGGAAIAG